MRVEVDLTTCQGYANCVMEAPDIFDVDLDTGKAFVLVDTVPPGSEDDARRAVDSCPVQAISVED